MTVHIAKWGIILAVFWLLLSGYIQPLMLSFGAISVALVLFVLRRMDSVDKNLMDVNTSFRSLNYLAWLALQIFKSSWQVTKHIWGSSQKLSPMLANISISNVPKKSKVLYANSITLTPGTLSIDLEDDHITVHALEASSIEELNNGDMEKKIIALQGKTK